jgi:uncharacterized protein YndB with AHSA1/START domain
LFATPLDSLPDNVWYEVMTLIPRIDSASRLIQAPRDVVYRAFSEPGAMEQWIPPDGMHATMIHFEFREGGSYRMRLTYPEAQYGQGKTSADTDEIKVRLTRIDEGQRIDQEIRFESDDPAFQGVMRMIWSFQQEGSGTLVTIRAEQVPDGISPEDHEAAMSSTLSNLATFVGGKGTD